SWATPTRARSATSRRARAAGALPSSVLVGPPPPSPSLGDFAPRSGRRRSSFFFLLPSSFLSFLVLFAHVSPRIPQAQRRCVRPVPHSLQPAVRRHEETCRPDRHGLVRQDRPAAPDSSRARRRRVAVRCR